MLAAVSKPYCNTPFSFYATQVKYYLFSNFWQRLRALIQLKKYGGPAGPLAQTVVAPDAATEGVLSVADATIFCSAWLAFMQEERYLPT